MVNVRHGNDSSGLGFLSAGNGAYNERVVMLLLVVVSVIREGVVLTDRLLDKQRVSGRMCLCICCSKM